MRWRLSRRALRAAKTPADEKPAAHPRLQALLRRIAELPVEREVSFAAAGHALVASDAGEEAWTRLFADVDRAVAEARREHDQVRVLVDKLRGAFDDLGARIAALGGDDRRRWRLWLRHATEAAEAARPRDDAATLRGLWADVRDAQAVITRLAPPPAPVAEDEAARLREEARGWIDRILESVRALPAGEEVRLLARLHRLQATFSALLDVGDLRALRVLLLHLEHLAEDVRRGQLAAGQPPTVDGPPP